MWKNGISRAKRMRIKIPLPDSAFQRFLEISVSDSGSGISVADSPKLFHAGFFAT